MLYLFKFNSEASRCVIDLSVQLDAFSQFVPLTPSHSPSVIKKLSEKGEIVEVNLVKVKFLSRMQQLAQIVINFCNNLPGLNAFTEHDRKCLLNGAITELLHIQVKLKAYKTKVHYLRICTFEQKNARKSITSFVLSNFLCLYS